MSTTLACTITVPMCSTARLGVYGWLPRYGLCPGGPGIRKSVRTLHLIGFSCPVFERLFSRHPDTRLRLSWSRRLRWLRAKATLPRRRMSSCSTEIEHCIPDELGVPFDCCRMSSFEDGRMSNYPGIRRLPEMAAALRSGTGVFQRWPLSSRA